MELFVVNLARSRDRRESMVRQLQQLGLTFRLFEGTDGADLTEEELAALCDPAAREQFRLNRGQIGCAHTYYRLYRTIVEEQIEAALILEDDLQLPPNLPQLIEVISTELRDDEVVLLLGLPTEGCVLSTQDTVRVLDRYDLCYPMLPHHLVSATAFMLKRPVAERLAEQMMPVRTCSDWWGMFHSAGAFESLRCLWPSPIGLKLHFASEIETRKTRHPAKKLLRDLANNPHLPLLNALLAWKRRSATRRALSGARSTDEPSPLAPRVRTQAPR